MINSNAFMDIFCLEWSISISLCLAKVEVMVNTDSSSWLGMKEACYVFHWMSLDVSSTVSEASNGEKRHLQPVPSLVNQ